MNVVLNLELIQSLIFFPYTLKIQYQNKTICQFKAVIKQRKKTQDIKATTDYDNTTGCVYSNHLK